MSEAPVTREGRRRSVTPVSYEHLWEFDAHGRTWRAELRDRGQWGFEVQIRRNGVLFLSRRFSTRALALEWADEEHTILHSQTTDDPEPPTPPDAA